MNVRPNMQAKARVEEDVLRRDRKAKRIGIDGTADLARTEVNAAAASLASQVDDADDAWVACVVILERLQTVAPDAKQQADGLLVSLAESLEHFRKMLRPIEGLLDSCAATVRR